MFNILTETELVTIADTNQNIKLIGGYGVKNFGTHFISCIYNDYIYTWLAEQIWWSIVSYGKILFSLSIAIIVIIHPIRP